jgi:trehalose 6-phosphate phosphatase
MTDHVREGAPALDEGLAVELRRLAGRESVLVALDFDGTLAPEVDVPADARALPAAVDQLDALQHLPGITIAFVSGRSLESLDAVVPPQIDAAMVGSHGLEVRRSSGDLVSPITPDERSRVDAALDMVASAVRSVDGAWIEHKPAGFAVHTRLVEGPAAAALQQSVLTLVATLDPAMTAREGKSVIEFAVRDATKGDGMRDLRAHIQPDAVLFAGDDRTDEDALAALVPGDLGIKVGSAPTIAPWRVKDPAELVAVLSEFVAARSSAGTQEAHGPHIVR